MEQLGNVADVPGDGGGGDDGGEGAVGEDGGFLDDFFFFAVEIEEAELVEEGAEVGFAVGVVVGVGAGLGFLEVGVHCFEAPEGQDVVSFEGEFATGGEDDVFVPFGGTGRSNAGVGGHGSTGFICLWGFEGCVRGLFRSSRRQLLSSLRFQSG